MATAPIRHDAHTLLARHAETDPSAPFLLFEDESGRITEISYGRQVRRAEATAAFLARHGVGAGDRVHLMTANRPEFLDLLFGCARLGAVLVPVNPLSAVEEVAHQVADSRAVVSVTEPALRETVAAAAEGLPVLTTEDLVTGRPEAGPPAAPRPRPGLAAIMFTSGTTSRPKGVRVSHANYVRVGTAMREHLRVTAADRWLVTLPLFHANAQYYCVMSALVAGASVALTARFSASRWPRQVRTLRPTLASLFAAPVRMVLARSEPDPADADNDLRLVLFAQNLADAQAREFEARFGAPLVQLYGMTETVLPPFVNPLDERRRWDSIGLPLPGVRVRVVDSDGRPVPAGVPGELQVGGVPGVDVTDGYDGRPEESAALLAGGWLRTGDLVRLDAEGRAYFVDRAKDMVKRSGENVAASEVERVLNEHPDVLESAVHGIPDPVHDEAIVAHVVPLPGRRPDPGDILAWCRDRLARFKVPGHVVVRDELPRTSVGKIRKDVLRAEILSTP
ncbi:crotonobetaine/carnitine-CoA ligase [Thermocatellispora tengchongensis]|uniref:Crotonobetaine/carnitine-CoA ligase n=1 Tax=Thermocatellispora tengchongensis TaxID=1073253 RepID=A0A840PDX9_9ACTN|nr:AMP-binding protein [Thermocatellispora tengchongensis]MBB5136143.1 crotonobetaine/carnitine-CoA ligase [Thermocatellispora tengchongensis]